MSMYELPKMEVPKLKAPQNKIFWLLILIIFLSSVFGFLAGSLSGASFFTPVKEYLQKIYIQMPPGTENPNITGKVPEYSPQTSQEEKVIKAVNENSPAVVSVIISKDMPILEQYNFNPFEEFFGPNSPFGFGIPQYRQKGTQKQEIGGGTGFIISSDGMILTNKHVVLDPQADYTVLTNNGKKFPAKMVARDPAQDLAIIKIDQPGQNFPVVKLGDSDKLQIGQSVIAIGNALGEFRNTVSVGVVSGLGRTVTAGDGGGLTETIEDVIQTDAAINKGNSGGPLLNLRGEVIGINTATALTAENISFAIPINKAKRAVSGVKATGKITYPFLGVRYVIVNDQIQEKNNLSVNYGALILRGENGEAAVTPGSAAQTAGLKEGDIILELNAEKITTDNSLAKIIMKYNAGDKVTLKILRNKEEKTISLILGERSE